MTSVTAAVATRDNGPGAMIDTYRSDFTTVLPSHIKADTWVRLAQGVLRRDKNLLRIAQQNPGSLMQALLECARLGHEPGTEAFYLVPMGGEIEGWEGYRGVIERMFRAGGVRAVKAELVRANDVFRYDPSEMDKPHHEVDWFSDRGPILGAYSYAEMVGGGTSRVVVVNQEYLAKIRSMSRGSDKPTSPWVKWEEAMVLKTVIHRLEPFVPTSSEYRDTIARRQITPESAESKPAITPVPDVSANVDTATGELHDGDVVDAEIVLDGSPHPFTWDEAADDGTCATCGQPADAEGHGGRE